MVKTEMAGTKLAEMEFPVERGKVREFAGAICDPNPVYRDREYARSKGFKDVLNVKGGMTAWYQNGFPTVTQ